MGFGSIGVIGLDGLIWEADNERPGPASPEDTPWGIGGCASHCMCQCMSYVPSYWVAPLQVSGSCWCSGRYLRCPGQAQTPSPMTAEISPAALKFSSHFRGCILSVVPHAMDWCGKVTGAIPLPPSTLGHAWGGAGEGLGAGGCATLQGMLDGTWSAGQWVG